MGSGLVWPPRAPGSGETRGPRTDTGLPSGPSRYSLWSPGLGEGDEAGQGSQGPACPLGAGLRKRGWCGAGEDSRAERGSGGAKVGSAPMQEVTERRDTGGEGDSPSSCYPGHLCWVQLAPGHGATKKRSTAVCHH